MQDWNIRAREHRCTATGEDFADGAIVYSRLLFNEQGYVREDFSEARWDASLRDGAVSVWKAAYRRPPQTASAEPLRRETAESLLRELMETEDEANRNIIFILAVMLERKRGLVERDVQVRPDGLKIRAYELRRTGEMFVIPDPGLRLDQLQDVQADVLARLGRSAASPPAAESGAQES